MIAHSIDIETLSSEPDAAIIQIGVATFDIEGQLLGSTGINIDYTWYGKNPKAPFDVSDSTMSWWSAQSQAARDAAFQTGEGTLTPKQALRKLTRYIRSFDEDCTVWANSPSFDLVILRHAYKVFELGVPWKFWAERDLRTLRALHPELRSMQFEGTPHCAVSDAMHQGRQVMRILSKAPEAA